MSDFYKRLDEIEQKNRLDRLFADRPDNLHDYQGCAAMKSDSHPLPLPEKGETKKCESCGKKQVTLLCVPTYPNGLCDECFNGWFKMPATTSVKAPDDCPWCGEEPEVVHTLDKSDFYVGCANEQCPIQPETGLQNSEAEAIREWQWKPEPPVERLAPPDCNCQGMISQPGAVHGKDICGFPEPPVERPELPALKSATHDQCERAHKREEFIHTRRGALETLEMREDELLAAQSRISQLTTDKDNWRSLSNDFQERLHEVKAERDQWRLSSREFQEVIQDLKATILAITNTHEWFGTPCARAVREIVEGK
jgi:hypothetical protein